MTADSIQQRALAYSGALHFVMLMLAFFGLPELWRSHREALPTAMTVEILPLGQTNVKPSQQAKPKNTVKPQPKTPKAAAKPNPPKPQPQPVKREAVPLPTPKEEKKPEPKPEVKKEQPKPEPKEEVKREQPTEDLDDILRNVEMAAQEEKGEDLEYEPAEESKKAVSDNYNPSLPLAMSEIDAIRQQFMRCWNVPAGARDAYNLKVVLSVQLAETGEVLAVDLASDRARYYSDTFFRAAADSAIRAVQRCSPLQRMDPAKYDSWKELELSFDPQEMLF